MVVIRLSRKGAKNSPAYRIMAADQDYSRDGRNLEILGNYIPAGTQRGISLNRERVEYWLSKGAQPSATVRNLLKKQGIAVH